MYNKNNPDLQNHQKLRTKLDQASYLISKHKGDLLDYFNRLSETEGQKQGDDHADRVCGMVEDAVQLEALY